MSLSKQDILAPQTLTEPALVQIFDTQTQQWSLIGTLSEVVVTGDIYSTHAEGVDICSPAEHCQRVQTKISGTLKTHKSAYILEHVYRFPVEQKSIGNPISIISEVQSITTLLSNEQWGAVLQYASITGLAQNIVVQDSSGAVLTHNIDYTLEQLHDHTVITTTPGGALQRGDGITVSYDYAPLQDIQFCVGRGGIVSPLRIRVLNALHSGITHAQQPWSIIIEVPFADVTTPPVVPFWYCGAPLETMNVPITITARSNTKSFWSITART